MRKTIKAVMAAVAIAATAASVPQDAALTYPQQPGFDNNAQLSFADRFSSALSFPLHRSEVAISDDLGASHVSTELPQPASLGQREELASLPPSTPLQGEDLVPVRQEEVGKEGVASTGDKDLSPSDLGPEHRIATAPSDHLNVAPVRPLLTPITRIEFSTPVLAPMAHTFFCLKYPTDCKVHHVLFRGGAMTLSAKRWNQLVRVNAAVNRAIVSHPNTAGLAGEKWLIAPRFGECHDYAVTKRHDLIALGWPERDLLLAEVITSWGEHHLVLVARTSDGDFVADSLTSQIRDWSRAPYQWVRVQKSDNPTFWSKVTSTTVWVKATGLARRES